MLVRETAAVSDFRNLYLVAGLRGGFERTSSMDPGLAEVALLHTLDERWGVPPPWGACDSGADLEGTGQDVLRGWCHVDLRRSNDAPHPEDVPLGGLLRTMSDALELFGASLLTGVDAIVPLGCVGEPMWWRVAGSVVRNRALSREPARVIVQACEAWPESHPLRPDPHAVVRTLSDFVDVRAAMGDIPSAPYPAAFGPTPFAFGVEHPWAASDTDPFRAEIVLPVWTIDDAAWLAEAVCVACARAGSVGDVQVALRRVG